MHTVRSAWRAGARPGARRVACTGHHRRRPHPRDRWAIGSLEARKDGDLALSTATLRVHNARGRN